MKFLIFFLVLNSCAFSQTYIESSYNIAYNGRNINFSYIRRVNNFDISGGLKYHFNRIEKIPVNTFFKNSAYAVSFTEKIGVQIGLEYYFLKRTNFQLGIYYNNQISFISQMIKALYAYDQLIPNPTTEFDYSYVKHQNIFGPVFESENTIGVALKTNLSSQFYTVFRGGVGMMFWKNTDPSVVFTSNLNQHGHLFTSFGSIGLGYIIK
jgi:hypothetical protein